MQRDRDAGHVHQLERPHADAERLLRRRLDRRDVGDAFLEQANGFVQPGQEEAVDDEAVRVASTRSASCPAPPAGATPAAASRGIRCRAGHDLDEPVLGRMEEVVQPEHALGTGVVAAARSVTENDDVLVARMASGRQTPSSRAKTSFLTCEILEHGLDHEVDAGEIVEPRGASDRAAIARGVAGCGRSSRPTPSSSVLSMICQPARDLAIVDVDEHDVESFGRHLLRDAAAHVAGADDGEAIEGDGSMVCLPCGASNRNPIVYDRPAMSREPERLTATSVADRRPVLPFWPREEPSLGPHRARRIPGARASGCRMRVVDGDGMPVPDALIELWQADADGQLRAARRSGRPCSATGFSRIRPSRDRRRMARCTFETIVRARRRIRRRRAGTAHQRLLLRARPASAVLYAHLLRGRSTASTWTRFSRSSLERRGDARSRGRTGRSTGSFDIRLQGESGNGLLRSVMGGRSIL